MITDKVIQAIEAALDKSFKSHVVPETEAYPTSGSTFIRVTGDFTEVEFKEASVHFVINFSVVCSIRTRDFVKQNKYVPYYELLDLQEQCFFKIISDPDILEALRAIAGVNSLSGRMNSRKLNTRVQAVRPLFFGSLDDIRSKPGNSIREAGYMLDQMFSTPVLTVPTPCLTLPSDVLAQIPVSPA